jgi:hypothetical protein
VLTVLPAFLVVEKYAYQEDIPGYAEKREYWRKAGQFTDISGSYSQIKHIEYVDQNSYYVAARTL